MKKIAAISIVLFIVTFFFVMRKQVGDYFFGLRKLERTSFSSIDKSRLSDILDLPIPSNAQWHKATIRLYRDGPILDVLITIRTSDRSSIEQAIKMEGWQSADFGAIQFREILPAGTILDAGFYINEISDFGFAAFSTDHNGQCIFVISKELSELKYPLVGDVFQ